MIRRAAGCAAWLLAVVLIVAARPGVGVAQMTISGTVTAASGMPVQGAAVTIPALDVSARTSAAGTYNFIIRASLVMGQTVAVTARHGRYGSQTVQIRITGGSIVRDFVLGGDRPRPDPRDSAAAPGAAPAGDSGVTPAAADNLLPTGDAPTDLASALAGRYAPLRVTSARAPGASAPMLWRGQRSLLGSIQPLVVVDGVPVENAGLSSVSQRFGLGGFDYGTALQDLALDDVERVELLDPVTATSRFGSRAANGVLLVTTKSGRHLTGFSVAATARYSGHRPALLPDFQNQFGQGSGGQYEFFDGQGGGIHDAVAESWGPRLDARAVVQHSLTEPGQPETRHWLPQPQDVERYFGDGATMDASIAVLGSRNASHVRAALGVRNVTGATPGSGTSRIGLSLGGGIRPAEKLTIGANIQVIGASADQRHGTGFDEINPVSGFTRMGRQVDLDALRGNITTDAGEQINWIYSGGRNNPFFATSRNTNDDERRHILAGLTVGYAMTDWLAATLQARTDDVDETRRSTVAEGWKGGYRSTLGLGDFSGGGSDEQSLKVSERGAGLTFTTSVLHAAGFAIAPTFGAEARTNEYGTTTVVRDQPADGAATITALEHDADQTVTSVFLAAAGTRAALTLRAGARLERSPSLLHSWSALYPTAAAEFDLASAFSPVRAMGLGQAGTFIRFWRAGNEITRRILATAYFDGVPIAPETDVNGPELTTGVEVGTRLATTGGRIAVDLTGYRERSLDVLVATGVGDGSALVSQTGQLFNGGLEAALRAALVEREGAAWDVRMTYAANRSTVDALMTDTWGANLSPAVFGTGLAARIGGPAGVIVGSRYLRNAAGALLLRNGLPIADAAESFSVLGSVHPDWTASVETRIRWRGMEASALLDARKGGRIFSATNMWGSYAGTLSTTLIGDRAPGAAAADSLTIAGVDSLTGAPNAVRVSAEQYFHALGSITEPWVYDASYTKLREVRVSLQVPTRLIPGFREHTLRASVIGRNLVTWAGAPNIDPETALSVGVFQGFEMGQLPSVRSLGFQLSIAP